MKVVLKYWDNLLAIAITLVILWLHGNRGSPKVITPDNGKDFTSGDAQNFSNSLEIKWKFSTEGAPWTGGYFERLIRSVKWYLKKNLGNKRSDYDRIPTIKEMEMVLSNRPVTYLYTESDLIEPVIPTKLPWQTFVWKKPFVYNYRTFQQ